MEICEMNIFFYQSLVTAEAPWCGGVRATRSKTPTAKSKFAPFSGFPYITRCRYGKRDRAEENTRGKQRPRAHTAPRLRMS